jgi:hypothetical protein
VLPEPAKLIENLRVSSKTVLHWRGEIHKNKEKTLVFPEERKVVFLEEFLLIRGEMRSSNNNSEKMLFSSSKDSFVYILSFSYHHWV